MRTRRVRFSFKVSAKVGAREQQAMRYTSKTALIPLSCLGLLVNQVAAQVNLAPLVLLAQNVPNLPGQEASALVLPQKLSLPALTYTNYFEEATAWRRLSEVVHHRRHGDEAILVPTRIKREVVEDFLAREVRPTLKTEEIQQAADVARFYEVGSVVPLFAQLLTKDERTMDGLMRNIECLRLLGDIGDEKQRRQAADWFESLLDHPDFPRIISQMIECYVHLDAEVTTENLATRIRRQIVSVTDRQASPAEPTGELILLREYLEGDLPVAKRAKAKKEALAHETEPLRRATGLARLYLGLDSFGGIDWRKWSAFALMAELRRSGEQNVVAGLKAALAAIPKAEGPDYRANAQARAFKAIQFFRGELGDEQSQWLQKQKTSRFQLEG